MRSVVISRGGIGVLVGAALAAGAGAGAGTGVGASGMTLALVPRLPVGTAGAAGADVFTAVGTTGAAGTGMVDVAFVGAGAGVFSFGTAVEAFARMGVGADFVAGALRLTGAGEMLALAVLALFGFSVFIGL